MKKLLFVLCVFSFRDASAQATGYVGINTVPVIARTLELTSELRPQPAYGITFNTGYTFNTNHTGFVDADVLEAIDNRKTSGAFFKLGGRVYLASLKGRKPASNIFAGILIIGSQYHQKAMTASLDDAPPASFVPTPLQAKGFIMSPAVNAGFSFTLSKKLLLEAGVQHTFRVKREDFIGRRQRNYQPGMGSGQSQPLQYLQGMLNLKYQL